MSGANVSGARRGALLGVAGAALAVGHWLTYAIGLPDPHTRERLLAHTGHGYLGPFGQIAAIAAVVTLAILFLERLTRGETGSSIPTFGRTFRSLAGFQAGAFTILEVAERLSSGASVEHLLHTPILPVGIGLQIALAALGAALVRWILRAAADVAERSAPDLPRRRSAMLRVVAPWSGPSGLAPAGPAGIRGPPPSSGR
jgi:hypothetical protein